MLPIYLDQRVCYGIVDDSNAAHCVCLAARPCRLFAAAASVPPASYPCTSRVFFMQLQCEFWWLDGIPGLYQWRAHSIWAAETRCCAENTPSHCNCVLRLCLRTGAHSSFGATVIIMAAHTLHHAPQAPACVSGCATTSWCAGGGCARTRRGGPRSCPGWSCSAAASPSSTGEFTCGTQL